MPRNYMKTSPVKLRVDSVFKYIKCNNNWVKLLVKFDDDNNTVNRLIVITNRLPRWVCRRLRVWNLEMMTFSWQENFFCNSVLCVPVLSSEPGT